MKVRNKKTGEIVEATDFDILSDYKSLTEFNEEWEDAPEEPKEYWYISDFGHIFNHVINDKSVKLTIEEMKSIGNYFETKEETEKAVEKLKAWKRLKDKGFKFNKYGLYHWTGEEWPHICFSYPNFDSLFDDKQVVADLDLLFGGEE